MGENYKCSENVNFIGSHRICVSFSSNIYFFYRILFWTLKYLYSKDLENCLKSGLTWKNSHSRSTWSLEMWMRSQKLWAMPSDSGLNWWLPLTLFRLCGQDQDRLLLLKYKKLHFMGGVIKLFLTRIILRELPWSRNCVRTEWFGCILPPVSEDNYARVRLSPAIPTSHVKVVSTSLVITYYL